jgi:hypothetical protein
MFFAQGLDGANHLGIAGEFFSPVIPGLRLAAHPGMTGEVAASGRRITLCALAKTQS